MCFFEQPMSFSGSRISFIIFLNSWQHLTQCLKQQRSTINSAWMKELMTMNSYTQHFSSTEWVSGGCSAVSDFLWPHGLYSPWNSPGQNTGVGSLSLLQGIFPTQGSNPGIAGGFFYQLSHKGSPRILDSLSLLQWIFPTHESNRGLLHCRQILHQLSYEGSSAQLNNSKFSEDTDIISPRTFAHTLPGIPFPFYLHSPVQIIW